MVKPNDRLVTGQLKALTALTHPAYQTRSLRVVFLPFRIGRTYLEVGFALICFQRLSDPDLATRRLPLA